MNIVNGAKLEKRLNVLGGLKDNWDSYGGLAITPDALYCARWLLESITIVPLSSGGIQIGISQDKRITIEITPEGDIGEIG